MKEKQKKLKKEVESKLKETEKLKLQIEALDSRRQKRLTTPKFILENNSSTNSINSIATDPSTNQEIEITSTSSNSNPPINYNINGIIASKFPELTNNIIFGRITGFQQDLILVEEAERKLKKVKEEYLIRCIFKNAESISISKSSIIIQFKLNSDGQILKKIISNLTIRGFLPYSNPL